MHTQSSQKHIAWCDTNFCDTKVNSLHTKWIVSVLLIVVSVLLKNIKYELLVQKQQNWNAKRKTKNFLWWSQQRRWRLAAPSTKEEQRGWRFWNMTLLYCEGSTITDHKCWKGTHTCRSGGCSSNITALSLM